MTLKTLLLAHASSSVRTLLYILSTCVTELWICVVSHAEQQGTAPRGKPRLATSAQSLSCPTKFGSLCCVLVSLCVLRGVAMVAFGFTNCKSSHVAQWSVMAVEWIEDAANARTNNGLNFRTMHARSTDNGKRQWKRQHFCLVVPLSGFSIGEICRQRGRNRSILCASLYASIAHHCSIVAPF